MFLATLIVGRGLTVSGSLGRRPRRATAWRRCVGWLAVGLAPGLSAAAGFDAESLQRAQMSITADDLNHHLVLLADDALEGRESGTRGGYTAGNYLSSRLPDGLTPAGDPGQCFQAFGAGLRNVLAVLPGRDEALRDEYILIGAHYDHVGYGTNRNSHGPIGLVHNGADDNASGTAALLEVIQAFSATSARPRRSILFAFWDGEEKGLLGSEHWAQHPTVALSQVRLAINADMVGRLGTKPLEVQGSRTLSGLRHLVAEANRDSDLPLNFTWDVDNNSDHYTFYQRHIPFVLVHTGLHEDYHRPSDDVERIDFSGLQAISRLLFNLVVDTAELDSCGPYRDVAAFENESRRVQFEQPQPLPPPRLGVRFDEPSPDAQPGVRVVNVRSGSPAERAGLLAGDRIVRVDGEPLLSSSTLQQRVLTATKLNMEVVRAGQTDVAQIAASLDGAPVRFGMSWRDDPADPGTVTVVSVIPHSPCHQAGVRVGDRLWQVNGQTFANSQALLTLLGDTQFPVLFLVERQGRVFELEGRG